MANDIKEGVLTVTKSLRSIFVGAHKKALQRRDKHPTIITSPVEDMPVTVHTVPFYNWLTNSDGQTEVF